MSLNNYISTTLRRSKTDFSDGLGGGDFLGAGRQRRSGDEGCEDEFERYFHHFQLQFYNLFFSLPSCAIRE